MSTNESLTLLQQMQKQWQEKAIKDAVALVAKEPFKFATRHNALIDSEFKKVTRKTRVMRQKVLATSKLCSYEDKLTVLINVLGEITPIKSVVLVLLFFFVCVLFFLFSVLFLLFCF